MSRRRFRPTLWTSLCTAMAMAVLVGLGYWQLLRLDWKEGLIAERDRQLAADSMPLPTDLADPAELEFRRVALAGRFDHAQELLLSSRTHKKQVGQHVFTPFVLEDGRVLLVNRGWVPMDRLDPARRADGQVSGRIALDAVLRQGGWGGSSLFQPDNRPADGVWLWVDLPAMAASTGLQGVITEVYAQAVPQTLPGGLPIGVEPLMVVRNDHLQYAITWFSLALVLLVIYIIFSLKSPASKPGDRTT